MEASLDKSTKKTGNKATNLLNGLGGQSNIVDLEAKDQILIATLNDVKLISKSLIRLSGTKTIKAKDNQIEITYLDGAQAIQAQLQDEIQSMSSNRAPSKGNEENDRLETIFQGLGGRENVTILDNCATRLRVTVVDISKVDDELLKATGAIAVVKKGNAVQVIYGLEVGNIKNNLVSI